MSWSPTPEMLWKNDPAIESARKKPGWAAFHRGCGRELLFFDHMTKEGRRYKCDAFTVSNRVPALLATGQGPGPLDALQDALEKSGRATEEMRSLFAAINGPPPEVDDDGFDSLMTDEFQELM